MGKSLRSLAVSVGGSGGTVDWSFDGQLDLSKGLDAFADSDLIAAVGSSPWRDALDAKGVRPGDAAALSFKVSLPGVVAPGGSDPAAWSARAGDPAVAMAARTTATAQPVLNARRVEHWALVALGIYAVVVAALVGGWFSLRRRQRARRA